MAAIGDVLQLKYVLMAVVLRAVDELVRRTEEVLEIGNINHPKTCC